MHTQNTVSPELGTAQKLEQFTMHDLPPEKLAVCHDASRHIYQMHSTINGLQAQLDALMLEFCPEQMTSQQIANWKASQAKSPLSVDVVKRAIGN